MSSHHLPDPSFAWATAGALIVAALWLAVQRKDASGRLFALLLLLLAVPLVDMGLMIARWPEGGIVPDAHGAVTMPVGLGLPSLLWSVLGAAVPVVALGFLLHQPARRPWLPSVRGTWAVAASGVVALTAWSHLAPAGSPLALVRAGIVDLLFPLVGMVFLAQAVRDPKRAAAPLLLSLAFLVASVPELVYGGVRDYNTAVQMDPSSAFWSASVAGALVGGLVALTVAAAVFVDLAVAFREGVSPRPFLGHMAALAALLVLALFAGERTGAAFVDVVPYAAPVLFAALGILGLMRTTVPGSAATQLPAAETADPDPESTGPRAPF